MTTRPRSADDYSEIARRQREIAAENGLAATWEICTCPPRSIIVTGCPVHDAEFRQLLESSIAACDCPADHDVQGIYRKVHVPGCLAHVWSPEEILAYRHWQARTAPDSLVIGRPEHGR